MASGKAGGCLRKDAGAPSYMRKIWMSFLPDQLHALPRDSRGKYKGRHGQGYWCNAVLWSQKTDTTDPLASLEAALLCNDLGLDGDNSHVPIALGL